MNYIYTHLLLVFSLLGSLQAYPHLIEDNPNSPLEQVTSKNYLRIKGLLSNETKVDIRIFIYNTPSDTWRQVRHINKKKSYRLKLDPTKEYQIWFSTKEGGDKRLFVSAGLEGPYSTILDIDFTDPISFAHMKQMEDSSYILKKLKSIPIGLLSKL